jgi:hypothetical protein
MGHGNSRETTGDSMRAFSMVFMRTLMVSRDGDDAGVVSG